MSAAVRSWAWLGVALLVALSPPPASAQAQDILGVTGEVLVVVPGDAFTPNPEYDDQTKHPEICGSPETVFQIDEDARLFRFVDTQAGTNCGEVNATVEVPPGITSVIVEFDADRTVVRAAQELPQQQVPTDAPMELRVYREGRLLISVALFQPGSGSAPLATRAIPVQLTGEGPITLGWYFADRGFSPVPGQLSTGSGDTVNAQVREPRVRIPGVAIAYGTTLWSTQVEEAPNLRTTRAVGLTVPSVPGASAAAVNIVLRGDADLTELRSPRNETIPLSRLRLERSADNLVVSLTPEVVAKEGPGTYAILLQSLAPIPPPPPPPPPTTIYPVVLALLAAPLVPGALAGRAGVVYRKEARGVYVRTAALIAAGILVLVLLWLLIVVYAFGLRRLAVMATLPLAPEAWLLNVALVVIIVGLVALWVIPSRYALSAMREDLAERRKQAQELKRSNLELEHFAYIASHDLQEPLRTISGFAQLLEKRYGEKLDDRARMYIERQVAGTQRMQALINDLLAYSRVQTQGKPFVDVDLDAEVTAMLSDLETFVRERRATVTKQSLPRVKADGSQIVQVFSNLVRNGIKYRSPEREPVVQIAVAPDEAAKEWVFSVSDNGKGIAPEYFEKIFIIFQRLEAREDTAEQGTGLGLAITKKIVERHGGRIWVESQVGAGSTFRFTIPYDPGEPR